jgi:hypothetical protein
MTRTAAKRTRQSARKKTIAKKRSSLAQPRRATPKKKAVKKFVSSFYAKYGKLMSKLSNE